jgi:glycosyltransferase involved in cell wall biosynthesis
MKISYITKNDASDVHNWSGLDHFIAKALEEQQADIQYVGNLQDHPGLSLRFKSKFYRLLGQKFYSERNPATAMAYARQVKGRIKQDSDIIFCPGTIPIALLENDKPKVFYTDATFAGMLGFYDDFTGLCQETIRHGNYLEQIALESSDLAIYASDWAAKTAIDNYQVDPAKVKVVPFGANITCNRTSSDIKEMVEGRSEKECNLLFLGVEWARKGGDIAVKVTEYLNKAGLKTRLHVAGVKNLPINPLPDHIVDHGFISKSTKAGQEKLDKLFAGSHFLLLPTRAEAYGLVFCEANSFGVPCIAPAIGGITTIIKNDVNGQLFSLAAEPSEYAEYILSVFRDRPAYDQLCYSSFNEYQQRLNWNVSGKTILNLLGEL